MTYQTTVVAATPTHYWPLNETSGTTAADVIAGATMTATGLTMGGAAAPAGIGGVAPVFTGTERLARTGTILGGLSTWTVEAWVYYAPVSSSDATARAFYAEMGTTGNDMIQCRMVNGSSTQMQHVYGDDAGLTTVNANTVFIYGGWAYVVFTRSGSTVEMWWNGGRRTLSTGGRAGSTWTNAGQATWIGMTPRSTNQWVGRVAHLATYNRVLTQTEIVGHYNAGTVLTRTPPNRNWWKPSKAVWNQRLDDAANVPTIASNSASLVTKLANQVTQYGVATSVGGGTFWTVTNATPKQRVRIEGGQNNPSFNSPDLYNALGNVPVPSDLVYGTGTDQEVQIYNSDSDELFEFWIMQQTLIRPEFVTVATSGAGTIPAGTYFYGVAPQDGSGQYGTGRQSATSVVVTGSQGVAVSWGTSEGAAGYQVWRRLSSDGQWHLLTTVSAATHSFTDTGALTPGAGFTYNGGVAVTTDWGCSYAGHIVATNDSIGVYEPPHQNWGASATSLPLWGGTVSAVEAQDAVTNVNAIPHALTMAVFQTANSHVYPAQRHDYFSGVNEIPEGTRFQLDPAFDINTITNPFTRALAKAFQVYGGYIRDHAGAITGAYVEDARALGRDPYPYAYQGLQSYEVLAGFPWSSMRVIDPSWTLTQTLPPPTPLSTLTDNFNNNVIDAPKWATWTTNVTETGGQLRLSYIGTGSATITSIGGGGAIVPWTLIGSELRAHVVQAAVGSGDQSSMRILSQIDLTHCRVEMWVDQTFLRAQYMNSSWTTVIVQSATFDPVAHAWWRVSESGGNIFWWTSPDGLTWTQFATVPWANTGWPSANLTNVVTQFSFGNFNATTPRPDFVIDDLNLVPSAPPPPLIELQMPITGDGLAVYPWGVSSTNAIITGVGDETARITGGAV